MADTEDDGQYDVNVAAINQHIKKVYDDSELEPN